MSITPPWTRTQIRGTALRSTAAATALTIATWAPGSEIDVRSRVSCSVPQSPPITKTTASAAFAAATASRTAVAFALPLIDAPKLSVVRAGFVALFHFWIAS